MKILIGDFHVFDWQSTFGSGGGNLTIQHLKYQEESVMKALKAGVVTVGLLLILGLSVTNAKAEYLGEFCWNVIVDGETVGTGKFGITHMGGNYYLIQGGSSEAKRYYSGSGLLIGNKIIFSMSVTFTNAEMSRKSGIFEEITIDLTTLNGSFWSIATEYFEDGTDYVHYTEGTYEYTSCQ